MSWYNGKSIGFGTSLVVQCIGLCASTAGGTESIPGQGTKIPHAAQCSQKKKRAYAMMLDVSVFESLVYRVLVVLP